MPPTIETQRSIAALARCSLDAGGQPLVGGADDAGEEDVGLVHQRLAAVGAEQRERLGVAQSRSSARWSGPSRRTSRRRSSVSRRQHHARCRHRAASARFSVSSWRSASAFGAVVGREIDLVAGDQEAALARFRGLHRVAQLDRRAARVARLDHLVEIDLRALAEPDRHADDAEQRQKPDGEQADRGTGRRNGWKSAWRQADARYSAAAQAGGRRRRTRNANGTRARCIGRAAADRN